MKLPDPWAEHRVPPTAFLCSGHTGLQLSEGSPVPHSDVRSLPVFSESNVGGESGSWTQSQQKAPTTMGTTCAALGVPLLPSLAFASACPALVSKSPKSVQQ